MLQLPVQQLQQPLIVADLVLDKLFLLPNHALFLLERWFSVKAEPVKLFDGFQGHSGCLHAANHPDSGQVGFIILPSAVFRPVYGRQQAFFLIVTQGVGRHPEQLGYLFYCIFHNLNLLRQLDRIKSQN
ncbi:hypothetical protein D3C81_1511390 [compost metagenome]